MKEEFLKGERKGEKGERKGGRKREKKRGREEVLLCHQNQRDTSNIFQQVT